MYVTGESLSSNFPTYPNSIVTAGAFIVSFEPSGQTLNFSTVINGFGSEGNGIVSHKEYVYVTGRTLITNIPTTPGAFQPNLAGASDAFVARFDASGNAEYITYLGGSNDDAGMQIAVSSDGFAWITGETRSLDFPTYIPPRISLFGGGKSDVFISQLSPDGKFLHDSRFIGGTGEEIANDIRIDDTGLIYLTGTTNSENFPTTANADEPLFVGSPAEVTNAFLMIFKPSKKSSQAEYRILKPLKPPYINPAPVWLLDIPDLPINPKGYFQPIDSTQGEGR